MTEIAQPRSSRPHGRLPTPGNRGESGYHLERKAPEGKVRVFIAAENRLLREALARVIRRRAGNALAGLNSCTFEPETLVKTRTNVLLIASRGSLEEDCTVIARAYACVPEMSIVLIGMARNGEEFLRCVRAGISGYLLRDASAEEVLDAVQTVHDGECVCPGSLCRVLFRSVEAQAAHEENTGRSDAEITRRQRQLIPLIAQGLTNKEIASQLSVSEYTIKNHIYRMMRKTGARSRLAVAQFRGPDAAAPSSL